MRIAFLALALCLTVLSACTSDSSVVGSGNVISQQRTVSSFSMIENNASIHVVVEYAMVPSVVVEADDNIVDRVRTTVENNVLKLNIEGGISNVHVTVRIGMPTVSRIANYGSGDVDFTTAFSSDNLDMVDYGSGNITFTDLTCQSLTTEQTGSGSVSIKGNVVSHNSKIRGSGDLHAFNCITTQTAVVIYGSGSADVNVTDRLFADIYGSGNITYQGEPAIDKRVTGSGKLVKKV